MKKIKEYITVTDENYHYTSGYFTMNKWTNNGDILLLRAKNESVSVPNELVYYSLSERRAKEVLCKDVCGGCVVCDDIAYFLFDEKLTAMDLHTGEQKVIYTTPEGKAWTMPHVTSDGKHISLHSRNESDGEFISVNAETGEVEISFKKTFFPPYADANHGMICPADPDLMFFAHEGETEYVTNRLWVYNRRTGEMRNMTKQEMDENMNLGECFGHEMWAPDGKGMYFVKYPQSPLKPTGLCYADLETGKNKVLFSGYPYWHVAVSQDGKYLAADTMRGRFEGTDLCDVVIADLADHTETVIDTVHSTGKHPCHPHPLFSLDSEKIAYTIRTDNNRTAVRIATLK